MLSDEIIKKINFVKELSKAIVGNVSSIVKVHYDVFVSKKNEAWLDEYVVVEYRGGAIQARSCNMNSCAAIFEEIGKMLYSSQVYSLDTKYYKEALLEEKATLAAECKED